MASDCLLLPATCHLPLDTCHLLLAACGLRLAIGYRLCIAVRLPTHMLLVRTPYELLDLLTTYSYL